MKLIYCKDSSEVIRQTNFWCERVLRSSNSIFLPTGSTPIPIYKNWEENKPGFLFGKKMVQLDEITSGAKNGSFIEFLNKNLSSFAHQFISIERAQSPADVAILGLGLNGHVAFHEPGTSDDFYKGELTLSKETCTNLKIEEGTKGMSFGLKALMQCKSILLIVRGENKKGIYRRFLNHDPGLPAVKLMTHSDFTVLSELEGLES